MANDELASYREGAKKIYAVVPKTHNCAQTVVEMAGRLDLVPTMAPCGGGRAPKGYCGALHGALAVTPEKNHATLEKEFVERVGAATCREIKGMAKTPCLDCMAVGALLAERFKG